MKIRGSSTLTLVPIIARLGATGDYSGVRATLSRQRSRSTSSLARAFSPDVGAACTYCAYVATAAFRSPSLLWHSATRRSRSASMGAKGCPAARAK